MVRIAIAFVVACLCARSSFPQDPKTWEANHAAFLERLERTRRGELAPVDENHPARAERVVPRRGGELRVALNGRFDHLNYAIDADYAIRIVWEELQAWLAVESPDGSGYAPQLATRWDVQDVLVVPRRPDDGDADEARLTIASSHDEVTRWIGTIESRGEADSLEHRIRNAHQTSPWFAAQDVSRIDRQAAVTFHLRPGVRWHDGEPFTAHDVVFSMDCQRHAVDGERRFAYGAVVEARALDEHTVRFVFERQYFKVMSMATSLPLLPAHLYEVKGGRDVDRTEALHDIERNRRFVGLGPYRLLSWEQGENLVLEHSPYWFGEDVWVDRIVYRFLDPQAAVREIRAGTLDFAPGLASRDFAPLEADAEALGLVTGQALGTGYMWIGWNCRRPGLDDPRVRLALSQAFDLQGFLHKYSTGWTMAVTGHQPPFSKAYATTITPIAFDVERTRELLAAAGYVDRDGDGWVEDPEARRLTIRFLYPTKSAGSFIAAHLAEGLKAAKVEVVHDAVEYGTYLTRRAEGNWDAIFQSWVLDRESDLYQVWHSSGAPLATRSSNYVGYANPSVDRVIEEARITLDDERRHTLWKRAEEIIYHEQPYCFLYTGASGAVWTARWRGVRMYDGRPTFRLREWFLPAE